MNETLQNKYCTNKMNSPQKTESEGGWRAGRDERQTSNFKSTVNVTMKRVLWKHQDRGEGSEKASYRAWHLNENLKDNWSETRKGGESKSKDKRTDKSPEGGEAPETDTRGSRDAVREQLRQSTRSEASSPRLRSWDLTHFPQGSHWRTWVKQVKGSDWHCPQCGAGKTTTAK